MSPSTSALRHPVSRRQFAPRIRGLARCGVGLVIACLAGCGSPAPPPLEPIAEDGLDVQPLRTLVFETRTETGPLVVDPTSADSPLSEGWLPPETLGDGQRIVWAHGPSSTIDIELIAPRDMKLEATGWPYRDPAGTDQSITVEAGGEAVGSWRMRPGTHSHEIEIPARLLRAGSNRVTLRPAVWRTTEEPAISAAFSSLELAPMQQTPPTFEGDDLVLPWGSELSAYVVRATAPHFVFDALEGSSDARLTIRVETEGSPPSERLIGPQETPGSLGLSHPEAESETSQPLIRLVLAAHHPHRVDGELRLRNPRLLSTPEDQVLAPPAQHQAPETRPDIVLVLVDTLRADRLGVYGAEPSLTPRIDAFADDAITFTQTTAQSSWTRTSMASAFTGLDPSSHRVETRLDSLWPQQLTLAEALAAQGYRTFGWTTNGNSGQAFGFDQGFEAFEQIQELAPALPARGDTVLDGVFDRLDRNFPTRGPSDSPLFLYIHTMEPHGPYGRSRDDGDRPQLSDEVLAALRDAGVPTEGPTDLGSVPWLQAMLRGLVPADDEAIAALAATYDVSVAETDRLFGRLLDGLDARGRLDDTIVVLLSDHGEEFDDHGGLAHGMTLYEEQLHVPFLLRLPQSDPRRGVRSSARARHVDLLPTLLDAAGLPPLPALDGRSLLDALAETSPTPAFARLRLDEREISTWIEGHDKLVCTEGSPCRLFDLATDPGEQVDRATERPLRVDYLSARLEAHLARLADSRPDEPTSTTAREIDPETERQLRALGYL